MPKTERQISLEPRKLPKRERGKERVGLILDATSRLLVSHGFDAVNTPLIAEEAGIPIGSIYQFFPNKYAIFRALAFRHVEMFRSIFTSLSSTDAHQLPWEELINISIDYIDYLLSSEKAISILWAAMRNSPEMRDEEAKVSAATVGYITTMLQPAMIGISPEHQLLIGRIVVRIAGDLMYQALHESGDKKARLVEELKRVLKVYVSSHVGRIATDQVASNG